uniref:Dolichyl-diphosphooligosaccharide--protein glycosyltransferase subunit KCP2 n=1 Tax=Elaeophora elaphi TaxID=1147741 RepID=A0A0R3RXW9_9BILA
MANHSTSAVVAFLIAIIFIGIGQVTKNDLAASKVGTLIAGALGSLVFVFLLTAMSNFQMSSMGEQVKAGLTEVFLCLFVALIASATIHRVAITVLTRNLRGVNFIDVLKKMSMRKKADVQIYDSSGNILRLLVTIGNHRSS